jgi:hypothetical protein
LDRSNDSASCSNLQSNHPTESEVWSDNEENEKPLMSVQENEFEIWDDGKETSVETLMNTSLNEMKERSKQFYAFNESLQFLDAESTPSSSCHSLSSLTNTAPVVALDWTKVENNYYFAESKKFAQQLWTIRQRNMDELKNSKFDANQFECFED